MRWAKYREMFSSVHSEWKVIEIHDKKMTLKDIEEQLENGHKLSTWSEHWHKVEIKWLRVPDTKYVIERIKDIKDEITQRKSMLETYLLLEHSLGKVARG